MTTFTWRIGLRFSSKVFLSLKHYLSILASRWQALESVGTIFNCYLLGQRAQNLRKLVKRANDPNKVQIVYNISTSYAEGSKVTCQERSQSGPILVGRQIWKKQLPCVGSNIGSNVPSCQRAGDRGSLSVSKWSYPPVTGSLLEILRYTLDSRLYNVVEENSMNWTETSHFSGPVGATRHLILQVVRQPPWSTLTGLHIINQLKINWVICRNFNRGFFEHIVEVVTNSMWIQNVLTFLVNIIFQILLQGHLKENSTNYEG